MNENLNLVEILKDCPKGTKFYTPIVGEVEFMEVLNDIDTVINTTSKTAGPIFFYKNGQYLMGGECMLFPSKDQRDWSKFKPKNPKFDPKTLQPFDNVLTRHAGCIWRCELFSHYREYNGIIESYCTNEEYVYRYCIPYNEDTKHLVGTAKEAPEFYRYWEE